MGGLYPSAFRRSEEGHLRRRTFELMDGKLSLRRTAYRLAAEFPQRFSSWQEALSHAGVVSQEYSRRSSVARDASGNGSIVGPVGRGVEMWPANYVVSEDGTTLSRLG